MPGGHNVTSPEGRKGRWSFEGLPPQAFQGRGVNLKEKLGPGTQLSISGCPAKDPAARFFCGREVTFLDKSTMTFGPTANEAEPERRDSKAETYQLRNHPSYDLDYGSIVHRLHSLWNNPMKIRGFLNGLPMGYGWVSCRKTGPVPGLSCWHFVICMKFNNPGPVPTPRDGDPWLSERVAAGTNGALKTAAPALERTAKCKTSYSSFPVAPMKRSSPLRNQHPTAMTMASTKTRSMPNSSVLSLVTNA